MTSLWARLSQTEVKRVIGNPDPIVTNYGAGAQEILPSKRTIPQSEADPIAMDSAIIRKLAESAHQAPSADNTQPWRIEWDGSYLTIYYDTARVGGNTFPATSHGCLLSIGALIENVLTVASGWGLQPLLETAAKPGSGTSALYARIALSPPPDGTWVATPMEAISRHTNRGSYKRAAIPESVCNQLTDCSQGSVRTWFSQEKIVVKRAAQLVKQASLIRFQTREVHEWLGRSLRFTPDSVATGDGLDIKTLGLPPGGGSLLRLVSDWGRMRLLNKIGLHRLLAAVDCAPVRAGPGLLAVVGPADPHSSLDAGRLLARQWTSINQAGLAAHPYYVVADQLARLRGGKIPPGLESIADEVAKDSTKLLDIADGETLHMLLRVGYPMKKAVRAMRLPLDRVYLDKSR